MIRELLLKPFVPVSRIFDNEDDIFMFLRTVRKSSASEILFLKNQKYYEILTLYECVEKYWLSYVNDLYGVKWIILRSKFNVATF